jgi:large subunit ribosomal protein L35e
MVKRVKAHELRGKSKEDLLKQLGELKQDLYQLKVAKVTGGSQTNLLNIKELRKGIARVLTVLTLKTREAVRNVFSHKKKKPLDLREKGTRAHRRKLKPRHLNSKLLKVVRREKNFPRRKFALRA